MLFFTGVVKMLFSSIVKKYKECKVMKVIYFFILGTVFNILGMEDNPQDLKVQVIPSVQATIEPLTIYLKHFQPSADKKQLHHWIQRYYATIDAVKKAKLLKKIYGKTDHVGIITEAQSLYNQGEFAKALCFLESLPDDLEALLLLGTLYFNKELFDRSRAYVEQVVAKSDATTQQRERADFLLQQIEFRTTACASPVMRVVIPRLDLTNVVQANRIHHRARSASLLACLNSSELHTLDGFSDVAARAQLIDQLNSRSPQTARHLIRKFPSGPQ